MDRESAAHDRFPPPYLISCPAYQHNSSVVPAHYDQRMAFASHAAERVALDAYTAAQATGQPITAQFVRDHLAMLLAHPSACMCELCDAAARTCLASVWRIADRWNRLKLGLTR